jgi:hypothetical protein
MLEGGHDPYIKNRHPTIDISVRTPGSDFELRAHCARNVVLAAKSQPTFSILRSLQMSWITLDTPERLPDLISISVLFPLLSYNCCGANCLRSIMVGVTAKHKLGIPRSSEVGPMVVNKTRLNEQVAKRLNTSLDWVWDHSSRKMPLLRVIRFGNGPR